jgi:hypothetical protein
MDWGQQLRRLSKGPAWLRVNVGSASVKHPLRGFQGTHRSDKHQAAVMQIGAEFMPMLAAMESAPDVYRR